MKDQANLHTKTITCLSSLVLRSLLLWLHNKSLLLQPKKKECHSEMVWYFIGVYMIKNRLLLYYMAA